ncbi:MAG: alpha/beta fold hydrolase [Planctomycetota bacterium]
MFETRYVDVGWAKLAVHTVGSGPPALLIHGYPLDHRVWLDLLASPLTARNTLVAVDLRGHGMSPWAGDPVHAMELFADDCAALIQTLALGPAHVAGLSMGGYVTLALWERHPKVVRSLALVDTRSAADSEQGKAGRMAAMDAVVNAGRRALALAMIEALVPSDADLITKGRIASMIEFQPVETIIADLRGMRDRVDRTWVLPTVRVPALVVVGERDTLTPPAEATQIARAIPGARLVVVPGSGHLVPIDGAAVLVRELGAFWRDSE